ncbi:MAG: DUF882 domain-containing protein [Pseudomonadota bacterium]
MSTNNDCVLGSNLNSIDRREILKLGLAGTLASIVPLGLSSSPAEASRSAWRVGFRHAHTGESFNGVYRVGNKYLPDAFERLNYVLRDFRTGEVFPMDPRVIDIMALVQRKARVNRPIEIFSGYRSPKTNSSLRRASSGVAKNSFHMYGQALDMHIDGYSTRRLRDIAMSLKAGGVGYYPRSQFVHVDTGSVRSWS